MKGRFLFDGMVRGAAGHDREQPPPLHLAPPPERTVVAGYVRVGALLHKHPYDLSRSSCQRGRVSRRSAAGGHETWVAGSVIVAGQSSTLHNSK